MVLSMGSVDVDNDAMRGRGDTMVGAMSATTTAVSAIAVSACVCRRRVVVVERCLVGGGGGGLCDGVSGDGGASLVDELLMVME